MSKNVAVFVDVANIFYAAKAAGVDIDYVTLLKSAIAGRDFVRAYAYTGLDPDNENQRNFHNFLARHGYKVVSKDIRKYGDGKVKANLDIELVVDMMKTARNLDVAIVVSGDGDFAPAIRAVQEMGVRVEVISFRGNTSSDLIEVADVFTDIIQLAKVEKGSSRSGRRVADDGEDLSMTEVPDKLTEGTGRGRGRSTGRGRGRSGEAAREPVAAAPRPAARSARSRATEPTTEPTEAPVGLVALPGEKLSKAAQARLAAAATSAAPADVDLDEELESREPDLDGEDREQDGAEEGTDGEGRRRRRRRGGRGRGRGRGRAEGEGLEPGAEEAVAEIADAPVSQDLADVVGPPRGPRPGAFGSVWDSQTGQVRPPSVETTPFDLEDEDEPAIPEYLLAEQRRSAGRGGARGGAGRGGSGRNAGYSAAVDRERYGRGAGGGGGVNRYPDVGNRGGRTGGGAPARGGRGSEPRRDDRSAAPRPDRDRPTSGRSDEPWSEVPPELEALLMAQLAAKGGGRPADDARSRRSPGRSRPTAEAGTVPLTAAERAPEKAPAPKRRTSTRTKAASETGSTPAPEDAPAPKRRTSTRTKAAGTSTAAATEPTPEAAPKRRTSTRTKAAATETETTQAPGSAEPPAPKPRATRKKAAAPEA